MKITIPRDELQQNINLNPDWYDLIFEKMEAKPSADKGSTNFIATFRFKVDGRTKEHYFNSKMLRLMDHFITMLTGNAIEVINGKVQTDREFIPEEHYGKEVKGKVELEPYQGILQMAIKDFLPAGADTTVPFSV